MECRGFIFTPNRLTLVLLGLLLLSKLRCGLGSFRTFGFCAEGFRFDGHVFVGSFVLVRKVWLGHAFVGSFVFLVRKVWLGSGGKEIEVRVCRV